MESIPHPPGNGASTKKPRRTSRASSEQVSDQIRGFHYDARRAALGRDYLRRKWLPREGPLFYAFVEVMRGHCYYNPQTGEIRESCYPKVETIAKECGVDPATIHRLIQRDKTTGEFISKHAEALKRFIKVQPRWLYDPSVGHKTQRSSVYLVALDDPPVPEDDHLVEEKEAELATLLTMERVRQQRQAESAPAPEERGTDLQNASQYALAFCESVMSRKMPDKTLPVIITPNTHLEHTLGGRSPVDWSRGDQEDKEKALVGGAPADTTSEQQSSGAACNSQPQQPPRSSKRKNHQRQALAQAYPQVGATIHQALVDLGGSNPAGGVKTILETLVEVAASPEQMHGLFALGLRRLEQPQELHTIPNPTGYLIGIMRNVVVEAMVRGWNVAHMRAEDAEKHAQALRSRGYAEPEAQASAAPGAPSATTETTRDEEPFTPDTTLAPESGDAEKQAQEDPFEAAQRAAREEAERYAHTLPDPQARQIWQSALERIRPNVSSSAFTTWFSGTKGLVFEDERLVVRVGSSFGREHLANRFHDVIERALSEQLGEPAEARFVIIPEVQEDDA